MDEKTLSTICEQVYHRFPEVKGARPKLQPMSKGTTTQHVLIFASKAMSESGKSLQRVVRVVVGDNGKIIKMSTSK